MIDELATDWGAVAIYPFEGPPYWPFPSWARRAEGLHVSPLGMLIHPIYGLWHSYRGALAFVDAVPLQGPERAASPCQICEAKPCLSACPVRAFSMSGYDVESCAAHVSGGSGTPCREWGCLARRACPVGREFAQTDAQARFHMRAFMAARTLSP